jgi:dTDP-4-dehydrorhamnose 3,5-epimerase
MLIKKQEFAGSFSFSLKVNEDPRGLFVKTYHKELFRNLGIDCDWPEQYVSTSVKGTLRGLHFQVPPFEHQKVVICLSGSVWDVVVDLRKNSPTYSQHYACQLNAYEGVYIPKGFAHGFCVPEALEATLLYGASTVYHPEHDSGLLWSSLDIDWPLLDPLLSQRDKGLVSFKDFQSPF